MSYLSYDFLFIKNCVNMWFENLMGFKEQNPQQVRDNLELGSNYIKSKVNGRKFIYGKLEIPTLADLKYSSPPLNKFQQKIKLSEVVGNVQYLHKDTENSGAVFQAASQFNLLEMVGPSATPERGVGIYENDKTQGPACAIACGAGTIYRNYFVNVNGRVGQTSNNQVDCLSEIGRYLGNSNDSLWVMKNGYALPTIEGLEFISEKIKNLSAVEYEDLKNKLKVGIQWNAEVTISEDKQKVSQVYCSALPVAYSNIPKYFWEDFAKLILDATYEATFFAALKNYQNTANNMLFLTLVGGGAFGNDDKWIFEAIEKSIFKFKKTPLDVKIVSYGWSNPKIKTFIEKMNNI